MKYKVRLTAGAQKDVDAAYSWLAERTTHGAVWFNGLEAAIEGLAEFPERFGLARESREFAEPVRQLLYGRSPNVYRVLFVIRKNVVYVLHVRHSARRKIERGGVSFPPEGGFSY